MMIDAIVPAHNEETTIGAVVETLLASGLFGKVIVVDDGSADDTAATVRNSGADVLSLQMNGGRANAIAIGASKSNAQAVAIFDADAENLTPEHVRLLVGAFQSGDYTQALATIDSDAGDGLDFLRALSPASAHNSGQRVVRREVLDAVPLTCDGYTADTAINFLAERDGKVAKVHLPGLRFRPKNKKVGAVSGTVKNLKMAAELGAASVALRKSCGTTCNIAGTQAEESR